MKTLTEFGLSENEVLVYCEALKHSESSPYSLAQSTGVPRTTVYDVLMSLSLKGLVELKQSDGFSKQQTRVTAKNPSTLRTILQEKRKELIQTEVDVLEILPLLKGEFHGEEANADFQFFPGIEGAKKVLFGEDEDQMDVPIHVFDNLMPMDAFGSKETDEGVDETKKFRLHAKHKIKEVFVLNDWTKHVLTYQYHRDPDYIVYREMRYLDNPILKFNQRFAIKGTRIMIGCAHEDEVWGLIINSKSLSDMMESIFKFIWQQALPVTPKFVESLGVDDYVEYEKRLGHRKL